jgi:carbon-monoxide dehydrogenase medium subunit
MKAVAFNYSAPTSLAAVCSGLAQATGVAKVMGGSQSLGPMLNLRLVRPDAVFDVSGLAELQRVSTQGGRVRIGAAVTHAQIEDGVFDELRGGMLQSVARSIAYRAVRNRGTMGGSLAHADPAADWVVVCAAVGAQIVIASVSGERVVSMDAFMLGAYTTALADGELIAAVLVPPHTAQARWAYQKLCRKTGEFSEATCAAWFDASTRFGRIVLGALDGAPRVLQGLTREVASRGPTAIGDEAIDAAVTEAVPDKDAIDRQRYRVVVRRCLEQLC